MDKPTQLKKMLREIVDVNPNLPIVGVVTQVGEQTCSVKIDSGLELSGVRLKATINDGASYFIIKPKIGSSVVLLSLTGGLENLTVVKVDQVQMIIYSHNELILIIDGTEGKIQVKNQSVSLLEILTDLGALLKEFKVNTPNGPSTALMPNSLQAIMQFETKVKSLLK